MRIALTLAFVATLTLVPTPSALPTDPVFSGGGGYDVGGQIAYIHLDGDSMNWYQVVPGAIPSRLSVTSITPPHDSEPRWCISLAHVAGDLPDAYLLVLDSGDGSTSFDRFDLELARGDARCGGDPGILEFNWAEDSETLKTGDFGPGFHLPGAPFVPGLPAL